MLIERREDEQVTVGILEDAGSAGERALAGILESFGVPVAVLTTGGDRITVQRANLRFHQAFPPGHRREQVLARVAAASSGGGQRVATIEGEGGDSWLATLRPIDEEGLLVASFTRTTPGDRTGPEATALRRLSVALAEQPDLDGVRRTLLDAATAAADAPRGALLTEEERGTFRIVGQRGDTGLPDPLVLDLAHPLWAVALGRSRLLWTVPEDAPPPFDQAGWQRGIVVRLPTLGRRTHLLAVAEPAAIPAPQTGDRLEVVAVLGAAALENRELVADRRLTERLLRASLTTAERLLGVSDPDAVLRRLVDGLVDAGVFEGVALWVPEPDGTVQLHSHRGLPRSVAARLREPAGTSRIRALTEPRHTTALRSALEGDAPSLWPGMRLRLIAFPNPADGVLGTFTAADQPELVHTVLGALVHAAAAALHQARLATERRQILEDFRRDLRPRGALPGVRIGHHYRAATVSREAFGGDFYDWFSLDEQRGVLAIGDVAGKGMEAASLTGMAVWSLRALGAHGSRPATVVHLLDSFVATHVGPERFITVAYAMVDTSRWSIEMVLAGHPPPVLLRGREAVTLVVPSGPPLGVAPEQAYTAAEMRLAPGDALVLVTDGVTEARRGGLRGGDLFGAHRLERAVAAAATAHPQQIADRVWDAVEAWTGGNTGDDCAIVALARPR